MPGVNRVRRRISSRNPRVCSGQRGGFR